MSRSVAARSCLALALVALGVGAPACSGTTSSTTTAVEPAIVLRGTDLTRGLGCGTGATQVFKYAAVLSQSGTPLAGGVYDCFADAAFVKPAVLFDSEVTVEVFLFTEAAFRAKSDAITSARSNKIQLAASSPTWTSQCTAVYRPDVLSYASCERADASAQTASVVVQLGAFAREGGTASCGVDYASARASWRVTSTPAPAEASGKLAAEACAAGADGGSGGRLVLSPAAAPATYELDLELLSGAGAVLGTTTCRATTSPGLTSTAVCDPVR